MSLEKAYRRQYEYKHNDDADDDDDDYNDNNDNPNLLPPRAPSLGGPPGQAGPSESGAPHVAAITYSASGAPHLHVQVEVVLDVALLALLPVAAAARRRDQAPTSAGRTAGLACSRLPVPAKNRRGRRARGAATLRRGAVPRSFTVRATKFLDA